MPKKAPEMSALQVRKITEKGKYAVGGVTGLMLFVRETGAKSWVLRMNIGGRRREIGLGGYPDVSLTMAREKAREIREMASNGVDPVAEREKRRRELSAKRSITFEEAARMCHEKKIVEFRNKKHAQDWISSVERYAFPEIGKMSVSDVDLKDILAILEPIWMAKTETATRLRQRIEYILNWATVSGYREGTNPARWKGHLDAILPKPSKLKKVEHFKALPWKDLPAFMERLRKRKGIAARALEFLILTATRSGEVRFATWDEIDFNDRIWIIPAARTKTGREHIVPLSGYAIEVLTSVRDAGDSQFIFVATSDKPLSDMSMAAVCKRMKTDVVPHGFRSTFRDWCAESTNFPREVAEMALAHSIGNSVEAAYRRGDLLEKRRRLMDAWAEYCRHTRMNNNVVPIGKAL